MRPAQIINEAYQYLSAISSTLHTLSTSYKIDKMDRTLLSQFAADLEAYSQKLQELEKTWAIKKEMERKVQEQEMDEAEKQRKERKEK